MSDSNPFKKNLNSQSQVQPSNQLPTPTAPSSSFNKFFGNDDDEYEVLKKIKQEEGDNIASFSRYRDQLELAIENSIKDLIKKYPGGGINRQRFITYDILQNSPPDYFERFSKEAIHYASAIREELANNQQSDLIANALANPSDDRLQNEAYGAVHSLAVEQIPNYRGVDRQILLSFITNEILGLSVLEPLWREESIDEIICNGIDDVQVEIKGQLHKVPAVKFDSVEHMESLLSRLYEAVGRVYSQTTPLIKARLHDNSRLFAVHPRVAPAGPNFNIRKHPDKYWVPEDLVKHGSASAEMLSFLGNLIYKGTSFLILGGTSTGKELKKTTKVPTPTGMTTIGELTLGDLIFDHYGNVGKVTNIYPQPRKKVYKVTFDTGEEFYAGADHNWYVSTEETRNSHNINKKTELYKVLTTKEMLDEGLIKNNIKQFRTPLLEKPVEFIHSRTLKTGLNPNELPIHPYLLGLWLGAGNPGDKNLLLPETEIANFNKILKTFKLPKLIKDKDNKSWRISDTKYITKLKKLGITKNFLIPNIYKNSSVEARRLLLTGMIDAEGSVNTSTGDIAFTNTSKQLKDDYINLLSSLGYKAVLTPVKRGRNGEEVWVVLFKSKTLIPLLHKKRGLQRTGNKNSDATDFKEFKTITKIEKLNKTDKMVCITVDTPDSTFLIGDGFTTTHNTSTLNALTGFYKEDIRIVTLEDNIEMKPNPKKLLAAAMEAKEPRPDKPNDTGVSMRDLVKASTQMRPDTIIIGEVTDGAALDLVNALNTGHNGASTLHANSEFDGVYRLSSLMGQTGEVIGDATLPLIAAAFDFIVYLEHFPQDGSRKIVSISEVPSRVSKDDDGNYHLALNPLWKFNAKGVTKQGKVVGDFVQVGEISEETRIRRHLDLTPDLSWDELKVLSSVE